jgi:Ca-activated chloride channel family protein
MSDEMDRLEHALKAAKPASNPDRKADILAMAQKCFDDSQETAALSRPIHKPAQNVSGIWTGVIDMLKSINLRPMLYTTSALCVVGLAFVLTQPMINDSGYSLDNLGRVAESKYDQQDKNEALNDQEMSLAEPLVQKEVAQITKAAPTKSQKQARERDMTSSLSAISSDQLSGYAAPSIVASETIKAHVQPSKETFSNKAPNPLKISSEEPVSTFSIDVDTASYAYVRSAIEGGNLPPVASVRIEELINYFPYNYTAPNLSKAPFSTQVSVFKTPWNPNTKLLHIGVQGAKPDVENRQPLNLVFLIDTSGSMQDTDKLPLLKQSFRLLLNTLRPTDKIAIVTYAGSAGTVLEPTMADDKDKILESLERLEAGGSTAGQAGLRQAYALAETMQSDDSIGRVLLATDGDFNVGISNPEELKRFVEEKRDTGVYLSVFGFGNGNYRDDMMQTLAQNGNGMAAYIDTLSEAQKVMVDQVSGALFPIANDVKIQVEFNPAQIAEYRLIGYETRALNREDFNNDAVDAGEIGAGHTVTAIYEITPVGSPAIKNDALRYQAETASIDGPDEYGFLKLRYKAPGASKSTLITTPISSVSSEPEQEAKFAAAIAGFGQLLTKSKYLEGWTWDQNIALANTGKGDDPYGYRTEAVQLMRLAKSLK